MPRRKLAINRLFFETDFLGYGATCVEVTSLGWVDRTGDIALQNDPLARSCLLRVRDGDSRHERFGIRMLRAQIDFIAVSQFHHFP